MKGFVGARTCHYKSCFDGSTILAITVSPKYNASIAEKTLAAITQEAAKVFCPHCAYSPIAYIYTLHTMLSGLLKRRLSIITALLGSVCCGDRGEHRD